MPFEWEMIQYFWDECRVFSGNECSLIYSIKLVLFKIEVFVLLYTCTIKFYTIFGYKEFPEIISIRIFDSKKNSLQIVNNIL